MGRVGRTHEDDSVDGAGTVVVVSYDARGGLVLQRRWSARRAPAGPFGRGSLLPDIADLAERKRLAEKIQIRATQTVPYVPIGVAYQIRAARADLTGLLTPPAPVYWNISRK